MSTHIYVYICISLSLSSFLFRSIRPIWKSRLVGSLKAQVSFAEYSLFYRALLPKTPIIWTSLLVVATPYVYTYMCIYMHLSLFRPLSLCPSPFDVRRINSYKFRIHSAYIPHTFRIHSGDYTWQHSTINVSYFCTHVCMYMYVCICMCVYVCMYMYVCICMYVYVSFSLFLFFFLPFDVWRVNSAYMPHTFRRIYLAAQRN